MIDKLVLRCAFTDQLMTKIESLNIPMEASIDVDGEVIDLRHAWERIPSSYAPMAFKVFDFRDSAKEGEVFVEIKASPAKLMQGHNIFGSDDLRSCALSLIELLADTYPLCFSELNQKTWEVVEADITYFSRLTDQREVHQFINALQNVSSGQTKSRTGYSGTAYFGKKNSRLKSIKVYDKQGEVTEYLKKLQKQGDTNDLIKCYTPELIEFTKGMVRWEVTLKKRWFERRKIPTKLTRLIHQFNPITYWTEATKDIFKSLEGEEMRIIKDDQVKEKLRTKYPTINKKTNNITYGKADSIYRTYRTIKSEGWQEALNSMSRATFYKHVNFIIDIGISKIYLQNLKGDGLVCEVIPFVRFLEVKFEQQFPENYQPVAA